MSTLGTLVANVQIKLSDTATKKYFTSSEIKLGIRDAYKYYAKKMISGGNSYFKEEIGLPLVANEDTIDLSALDPAFFGIYVLWKLFGTGKRKLDHRERLSGNIAYSSTFGASGYFPTYRIRNRKIVLLPGPSFSESATSTTGLLLEYYYQPEFPTSSSSDSFVFDQNFPEIYEDMIEDRAALFCMENKDTTGGISDMSTIRNRLQEEETAFYETLKTDDDPDRVEYVGNDYTDPFSQY